MKNGSIFAISIHNLVQRKRSSSFAILGIVIGISALICLWSLIQGVKDNVVENLAEVIAPDEIVVTPYYRKLYFMFESEAKDSAKMDQVLLEEIASLPQVEKVYPEISVVEQATAYVNFQDKTFVLDAPLFGMPKEYFPDIPEFTSYSLDDDVVPVILSRRLLDIYNLSFANAEGFYRLNGDAFIGLEFTLKVGYSSFFNRESERGVEEITAKFIGFAENVPIAGVMMPDIKARELNTFFLGEEQSEMQYSRLVVKLKDAKYVPEVSKYIADKKLTVSSLQEELTQFNNLVQIIILSLSAIILIILIVSSFNIYNTLHAAVLERKVEIGLWKACGATNNNIWNIYFYEAVVMGAIGAILGMIVGILLALGLEEWLRAKVPELVFLSRDFINFEWYMFIISLIVAILIAGLAGVGPARKAAKLYPIEVLRG